jgi:virulence factor Mce-like protein
MRRGPFLTGLVTSSVLLVVMAVVFISGIPAGPQIPLPWNPKSTLNVQLADADALAPHASVEMAGVKVGEVESVNGDGNVAVATLQIQSQYFDVHRNATIYLRPHGLFGPKYIDIVPGTASAPLLQDGATIAVAQTVQPVDLNAILQDLQAPEQQNLRTFLVEFGAASAGQGDDVNHLFAAADSLSQALDTPLKSIDTVGPQLSDMIKKDEAFNYDFAQTPLDQLVANNETTIKAFADNASHLESLLIHADSSLTQLNEALNGESGNLATTIQTLGKANGTVQQLDEFTYLVGLFGANLTGKDTSYPHDANVTQGILGAIENVKSALSSFDTCTGSANHCTNGQDHYLQVQSFGILPSLGPAGAPQPGCLPVSLPGITLPCPTNSASAISGPGRFFAAGDELQNFGAFFAD